MAAIGNGQPESGKISWFGGPHDSMAGGAPASGLGWIPGISTYNHNTLGGYWLVHMPNGQSGVLRQTDIGPAPWTGRNFDFTYNALPKLGYSEGNFPTNANIQAQYLGKSIPGQYAHLNLSGGGAAGVAGALQAGRPGQAGGPHPGHSAAWAAMQARGGKPAVPGRYVPGTMGSAGSGPGLKVTTIPATPDVIDKQGAIIDAMLHEKPISMSGKVRSTSAMGDAVRAIQAGKWTTPGTPATTQITNTPGKPYAPPSGGKFNVGARAAIPGQPGSGGVAPMGRGGADVNPLPAWRIGRTDMGVDANAAPGQPIRAINDSKVVHIYPNWFAGQPYMLMQLTAGPNKGRYWYVSEQIDHLPAVGTHIARNQTVARYASSGTGIEIGWGTPGWQTQAQASGNTGDASHGNSPAGLDFLHKILHG